MSSVPLMRPVKRLHRSNGEIWLLPEKRGLRSHRRKRRRHPRPRHRRGAPVLNRAFPGAPAFVRRAVFFCRGACGAAAVYGMIAVSR